uniref:Uncharacterized protein n=1 Tax=Davidia involucrata TaxID=16924 RepID=A0A5B7CC01_DAVIN
MEEHKWRYLQNFLQRTQKGLAELVQVIKEKEERVRQCYGETIDFGSDQFVEIITVDSDEFYFSRLQEQLDDYYYSKWHKWKAILKHDYFKTPWMVISFMIGGVVLIFTLIQSYLLFHL